MTRYQATATTKDGQLRVIRFTSPRATALESARIALRLTTTLGIRLTILG